MAIYTRKGDKGKTSLFDGTKVSKSSLRIEAVGHIDELNTVIGLCLVFIKDPRLAKELEVIQNDLFEIGGALAFPHKMPVETIYKRPLEFEKLIDGLTKKLPPLTNFILPGGGKGGAFLHLGRTVARRAERQITALSKSKNLPAGRQVDPEILVYLNRLSDLLFTMARWRKR